MATKKITDLVELTSAASGDVLPIVDINEDITKKIQVINFPISTATQTAIDAKQDTLVSGTNIKTINSTSLLGSGDISIEANPSGGAGAIQFSDGSAFASDSNLFWDNTNKRLGVGTNTPTAILQAENSTNGVLLARFKDALASTSYIDIKADPSLTDYTALYFGSERRIMSKQGGALFFTCSNTVNFVDGLASKMAVTPTEVQIGSITGARLGIKGSGSTSATTALLVQNSSATELFKVADNGGITMGVTSINNTFNGTYTFTQNASFRGVCDSGSSALNLRFVVTGATKSLLINADYTNSNDASAMVEIQSTTKGFLPPKMTTTQKNAIATPASGLQVYDTTLNQMSYYNGTSWVNF